MPVSRRNALTLLGLAPVGGVAIATQDMYDTPDNGRLTGSKANVKKIAAALRKLADEIDAESVWVTHLDINSEIVPRTLLTQTLSVKFTIRERPSA